MLKKLVRKNLEAKQIVKTTAGKNLYEAWRRLHFTFDPQTATVECTAMSRILTPTQAQNSGKLAARIPKWEERIKQIAKIWKNLPNEKRVPFVTKARENRTANRMNRGPVSRHFLFGILH